MAETRSRLQMPAPGVAGAAEDHGAQAFRRGLTLGQQYADVAVRRVSAWAEENPGQVLLAGLAAGFILGKLLFRPRRAVIEELD